MKYVRVKKYITFLFVSFFIANASGQMSRLQINDLEYFEMPGLSVMVFHEDYPEGHQGGITIIQHGVRVAAAYRPLKNYERRLTEECLQVAEAFWEKNKQQERC